MFRSPDAALNTRNARKMRTMRKIRKIRSICGLATPPPNSSSTTPKKNIKNKSRRKCQYLYFCTSKLVNRICGLATPPPNSSSTTQVLSLIALLVQNLNTGELSGLVAHRRRATTCARLDVCDFFFWYQYIEYIFI
jgi:hypothetical protein